MAPKLTLRADVHRRRALVDTAVEKVTQKWGKNMRADDRVERGKRELEKAENEFLAGLATIFNCYQFFERFWGLGPSSIVRCCL